MKKNKFFWLLSLTLVSSAFLAACGDKEETTEDPKGTDGDSSSEETIDAEQVLNLMESAEVPTMDTALGTDSVSFNIANNVNEGLYRMNQENVGVPAIAAGEPTISEDLKTYTFKLREDAKWSDGTPVTAKDFEFSWKRAIDPATASEYGPYMMGGVILNANKIAASELDKAELGVKALDDYTLEVKLERPTPYFLSLMSFATFLPQNEAFVTSKGADYAKNSDNVLYNGPFVLTEWDNTSLKWVYKKNEQYWDAASVKLTQINVDVVKETATAVNLYTTGQKDRTGLSGEYAMQYAADPDLVKSLEPTLFYLKFNQERGGKATPLANVNVREAVAKAFNKEDMANVVLANGSIGADYFVPKEFTYDENAVDFREVNGNLSSFNADEAKAAWEKGLGELGVKELTLELLGGDTDVAKKLSEYMKSQLETNLPGLTVTLKEVPFAVRLELDTAQDYDIQTSGWGPDYQDPMTFMDLNVTGGNYNRMSYSNPEFDKLIKAAQQDLGGDLPARWQAMADAEKILLAEDFAVAPMYQRGSMALMKPYVKGLVEHPFGADFSYKWAYISGK